MGKKNIIGLSILLLVFLLGLSTTSYAKISDDFSYEEFQNIIYNMITNEGTRYTDWAESVIENNASTLETIYNVDRDNYFIGRNVNSNNGLFFAFYDTNTRTIVGSEPNYRINITNDSGQTKTYWYLPANTNFNTILTDSITNGRSLSIEASPYLVSTYTFTGQGLTVPAGCNPSSLTSGPYETTPLKPVPELIPVSRPGSQTLYINDANLPAYEYTAFPPYNQGLRSMKFSTMYCPLDYKIVHYDVGYYYYNKFYNSWFVKTFLNSPMNWSGTTADLIRGNAIVGYNTHYDSEESEWVTEIYINNEYVHPNCAYIIEFELLPEDSIASGTKSGEVFLFNAIYLTDENTVIVDGNLDIDNTFNDNYYDGYKGDTDDINQKATDTTGITDIIQSEITDVPNVGGMLSQLTSGDMFSFADNLGFVNRNDSYWNFLYQYTYRICQVLLQDTDPYFDFQLHGETPTRIYAHDIGIPANHPLRPIVSMFFLWGFVWIVYLQFKNIVEAIETANAPKVAHLEDADMIFYV